MKLHDSIGPNPRVVRVFAAEKGIALDKVTVDLMGGENRQPGYLAKVPSGGLPALELDDGRTIAEVTVICDYLEELHPSPPLIGATPEARAEARMWTRRIDHLIVEPMTRAFRSVEGKGLFASRMTLLSEAAAAELKAITAEQLLWLDGQMAGRQWICGDRYTIADIFLLCFVEFGAQVAQPLPAGATWLADWAKRAGARPASAA